MGVSAAASQHRETVGRKEAMEEEEEGEGLVGTSGCGLLVKVFILGCYCSLLS